MSTTQLSAIKFMVKRFAMQYLMIAVVLINVCSL